MRVFLVLLYFPRYLLLSFHPTAIKALVKSLSSKGAMAAAACTLDPRLKQFIDLIFDQDMMRRTMANANIDLNKMPLG